MRPGIVGARAAWVARVVCAAVLPGGVPGRLATREVNLPVAAPGPGGSVWSVTKDNSQTLYRAGAAARVTAPLGAGGAAGPDGTGGASAMFVTALASGVAAARASAGTGRARIGPDGRHA